MRNADLSPGQRELLAAVARLEVYRDAAGVNWRLPLDGRTPTRRIDGPDLLDMETAGLVTLREPDGFGDRYYDLTDKEG